MIEFFFIYLEICLMQTLSPRKSGLFTPFMGVGIVIIIKSESEIDLNEFENFKNFY